MRPAGRPCEGGLLKEEVIRLEKRKNKMLSAGILLFGIWLAAALVIPEISPYTYTEIHGEIQNQGSSLSHLFGTDKF